MYFMLVNIYELHPNQVCCHYWGWSGWYLPPTSAQQLMCTYITTGAAAAAAFASESVFEVIRVFERREVPGGTW